MGSLSGFGPLCVDLYLPALPAVGHDLHASASLVQLSLTSSLLGLAFGQVVVGPLSDRFGRRRPLFFGMAAFVVASIACAFATGIGELIGLRFVQGLGGAAGVVISRAVVRDLYSGATAARFYSLQMLVVGAGPILAPQLGAGLLHLGSWRLLFIALALAGAILIAVTLVELPETLAPTDRRPGGVGQTLHTMAAVVTERSFIVNSTAASLAIGAIFAYVAGSSFALQNVYRLSPQAFSAVFAMNAVGLVGASVVNSHLVGRIAPRKLMTAGIACLAVASLVLVVLVSTGTATLLSVVACMFVVLTSLGFIGANATALALHAFPASAGSASALLGMMQFTVGATVAPLVGLGGTRDALPMAIVMTLCGFVALGVTLALRTTSQVAEHHVQLIPGVALAELGGIDAQPL